MGKKEKEDVVIRPGGPMQPLDVLVSMGYRPMDSNRQVWGKPVAYSLLVIKLATWEISQVFVSYADENVLATYASEILDPDDLEMGIKVFEAWKLKSEGVGGQHPHKRLNFISTVEQMGLNL